MIIYWLSPQRCKNVVLLAGSLIFYSFGEPKYLVLLMVSVLANYFTGLRLEQMPRQKGKQNKQKKIKYDRKRKRIFITAIVVNIGVLAVCKAVFDEDALPLGISFYTFQILSYLADVYNGEQKKETSFVCFATYITMFPQLIAGPIVRYGEVREKLYERKFNAEKLQEGLKVFTMGLAAKVLLADRLGLLWQEVQVTGFESISTPLAWMAAAAYSMKIYFDFYGYSLMALGLGRMLGFELPENFRTPYMAGSVRDFYRRWHMTLGEWFCRYIYIPLGGSRRGEVRTVFNLLAVWGLTAIWHGSTKNFLIWGMLLWLLIVFERQMDALGAGKILKGPLKALPHLYLWAVIPVTWICFAVTDISQLQIYLGRMFGTVEGVHVSMGDWFRALQTYWYLFGIGGLGCTAVLQRLFRRWKDSIAGTLILVALFWLCVWRLQVEGDNPFMYFRRF
ncbi:MAG: MBOAT family protein [Firmicutes bacterium]|nr:MBOAT family protein [Bacillota bacterium]